MSETDPIDSSFRAHLNDSRTSSWGRTVGGSGPLGLPVRRLSRGQQGLAFGVAALMLLSSLAGIAAIAHPPAAGTSASPTASSARSAPIPDPLAIPATASDVEGACHLAAPAGAATAQASEAAPAADVHSAGAPLFNSQVEPYAQLTGPYDYVAGGAAMRDQGYGNITLSWPGTSTLVQAYMVWSLLDNVTPPAYGTLNGVNVTGTWTAYATPSPCWAPTYIYTFVADVTDEVVNGVNALTDFPSGITTGDNPWAEPQVDPMDEGATLVAVFTSGSAAIHEVTLYTGARTTEGDDLFSELNYSKTNSPHATTTYIVADGQLTDNPAGWNGTIIQENAFNGTAPRSSGVFWTYGNLWDTKTYSVNVTDPGNNTTAEIGSDGSDCLTWIGQVVDVGVPATKGPYAVDFEEQGLPVGQEWNVSADSSKKLGTVTDAGSTIEFSLANGTYPYSITPIPGYSAQYRGSVEVDGGPVLVRVAFHVTIYNLRFTESGLPTDMGWTVHLWNTSQDISVYPEAVSPGGVTAQEANGTYNFSITQNGLYLPRPVSGTVKIDGASQSVPIVFVPPPLYAVTIVQHGLPIGTSWGAGTDTNWGDFENRTTNRSFVLLLPNTTESGDGLYPYYVAGYSSTWVYFDVTGAPETIVVTYSPYYTVDIVETGLPADTYWYANLTSESEFTPNASESDTIGFAELNGSYTFEVTHVWGYQESPVSGPVSVDGADVEIDVTFTVAPTYGLTFSEVGLPAGTSWTIEFEHPGGGESPLSSTDSAIDLDEPNGTYYYWAETVRGYSVTPSSGSVRIDGGPASVVFHFTEVFSVTFAETGLPSGTYWSFDFNGTYEETDHATLSFFEKNGSLSYAMYTATPGAFEPTPASGTVVVDGANETVDISYTWAGHPTYTLTFEETGLAPGTNWTVEIESPYWFGYSTGTSIQFVEVNGTYEFYVYDVVGYTVRPQSSEANITGENAVQPVVFKVPPPPLEYTVTFTESGLPSGDSWAVTFDGDLQSSITASDVFSIENGTYDFSVTGTHGYTPDPSSGALPVLGEDTGLAIVFSPPPPEEFVVTFTESGLPDGKVWWINLTGQDPLSSETSTITVELLNGTYSYTAAADSHLYSAPGGSVKVDGANLPVAVPFSTAGGNAPSSGFLGLGGSAWYWIVAIVVLLGLLLIAFIVVGRRRKKKEELPPPPPGGSSGTGPSSPPSS